MFYVGFDLCAKAQFEAGHDFMRRLLERHVQLTDSAWGTRLLEGFEHFMFYFRVVRPRVDKEAMKQGGTIQKVPLKVVG